MLKEQMKPGLSVADMAALWSDCLVVVDAGSLLLALYRRQWENFIHVGNSDRQSCASMKAPKIGLNSEPDNVCTSD